MDPDSVLSGWTGSSTNVVVHVDTSGSNDPLTVYDSANATQLKLGTVSLGANYVTGNRTFGATGAASTMVMTSFVMCSPETLVPSTKSKTSLLGSATLLSFMRGWFWPEQ